MAEFVVPGKLSDLELPASGQPALDVGAMSAEEAEALVESVTSALVENEATCVTEAELVCELFALTSDFTCLPPGARARLVDGLCSNLSVLSSSCALLDAETDVALLSQHRSALKAYCFFLSHILVAAEREAREAPACAAPKPKGVKPKGAANKPAGDWDWEWQRERLARPLASALDCDLGALWRGRGVEESFLNLFVAAASQLAEAPPALKNKAVRAAIGDMFASVAVRHNQLVTVTTALIHLLNKHEHLPARGPIAEWCEASVKRYSDTRLAQSLLREIGAVDPHEYKRQSEKDSVGVRNVGSLLVDLAERLPLTVGKNISLLRPHLDGEAPSLRCALVSVIGHLVIGYSDVAGAADQASAPAASQLRAAAKQGFLDCLTERAHDTHAFTRARVLTTWALLSERKALPLPHIILVADVAVGRLADTKAVVRKAAAQLLHSLVEMNPFAPELACAPLEATLAKWTHTLQEHSDKADAKEAASQAEDQAAAESAVHGVSAAAQAAQDAPSAAAMPSEADALAAEEATASAEPQLDGGVEALRTMVAALSAALAFARKLTAAVPALVNMLSSAVASDAVEAVACLVACRQFGVDGAATEGIRAALRLVFSREQPVRCAALEAAETLFLKQEPAGAAVALLELVHDASLGDVVAAEEILTQLLASGRLTANGAVMRHLWGEACGRGGSSASALERRASAMQLLTMAGGADCDVLRPHVTLILDAAAAGARSHAPLARAAAAALARCCGPGDVAWPGDHAAFETLSALLSVDARGALAGPAWFPVAEQALSCVYARHCDPEGYAAQLLAAQARDAGLLGGDARGLTGVSACALARFLFTLGAVALRQLVHVEAQAKALRSVRLAAEKRAVAAAEAAAEAAASKPALAHAAAKKAPSKAAPAAAAAAAAAADKKDEEPGGLAAQLGQGAAGADAELDAQREAAEAQLVGAQTAAAASSAGVVALFAPFAVAVASSPALLAAHPLLRGAALGCLTRLAACDAAFCEANLSLLFTRLRDTSAPGTRASLMVALGDLAFRFPNAVEPWTPHVYGSAASGTCLHDPDASVRKHSLTVLSHLVLNDMMKVKGHIADMARCLEDPVASISALARLFFFELSQRTGAPIYNLLPDLLSRLSADTSLDGDAFARVMKHLLGFIDKDKQTDALVDKLLARMPEAVTSGNLKAQRDIAFCVGALQLSEKGVKRLAEGWKLYEPALGDEVVAGHLEGALRGAKKSAKPENKTALDEFEAKLRQAAAERAETARAAARAEAHETGQSGVDCSPEGAQENHEPPDASHAPAAPAGKAKPKAAPKKAAAKPRVRKAAVVQESSEDDEEEDRDAEQTAAPKRVPLRARGKA